MRIATDGETRTVIARSDRQASLLGEYRNAVDKAMKGLPNTLADFEDFKISGKPLETDIEVLEDLYLNGETDIEDVRDDGLPYGFDDGHGYDDDDGISFHGYPRDMRIVSDGEIRPVTVRSERQTDLIGEYWKAVGQAMKGLPNNLTGFEDLKISGKPLETDTDVLEDLRFNGEINPEAIGGGHLYGFAPDRL